MNIRLATEGDAGALRRLRLQMLEELTGPLPQDLGGGVQAYLEKHLADESCLCAVAETGGEIVSMAMLCRFEEVPNEYSTEGKSAKLTSVYTLPAFRGRGYMEKLLSDLLEEAKRRGIKTLYVAAERKAIPLYQRVGFRLAETMLYMVL